jgi:hypothetical protein
MGLHLPRVLGHSFLGGLLIKNIGLLSVTPVFLHKIVYIWFFGVYAQPQRLGVFYLLFLQINLHNTI